MKKWLKKSNETYPDEEMGDRAFLLQQANVAEESLDALGQSRRALTETNEIGTNVMSQLLNQRESIMRTKQHVEETGTAHQETYALINSIRRSEFYTKLFMYITIFLLILAILLVSIYKLLK